MSIDSIKTSLDQLTDWWPENPEPAAEQTEQADWLGWDGWVDVGTSHSQTTD